MRHGCVWWCVKQLVQVLAVTQVVSSLVACVAVLLASGQSSSATTVDSGGGGGVPQSVATTPPQQQVVVDASDSRHCCMKEEVWPCPRDRATPSRALLGEQCGDPEVACASLPLTCLQCMCNYSCAYGRPSNATCAVVEGAVCSGERKDIVREFRCSYCYLTERSVHWCSSRDLGCRSVASPTSHHHWYVANCTVSRDTLCLGKQVFSKRMECNWTEGYSWKTALVLSVTLGGFGADRFYLGHWQEGIGKLFSFGGLGVWTLVDVVLVAIGYIGPADGSLYI